MANDTRLGLLAQLVRKQPQSVSQLAEKCSLTLPVASQSLRALEARGLLRVRRIRRRVEYRAPTRSEAGDLSNLLSALQAALLRDPEPHARIAKLATAFTHASRIEIYRALESGPKTAAQIQAATRLPAQTLMRHVRKLLARGFIGYDDIAGKFEHLNHPDPIARALREQVLSL